MSSDGLARRLPGVDGREFRRACGSFATGVTIASVVDRKGIPHGLTVSSFTSVSLDPPLILICLGHEVTSIEIFRASKYFGINVLSDSQAAISNHFATKGADRFTDLAWQAGETGVPMLDGALAHIECVVTKRFTAGDHDIFIGEMLRGEVFEGEPLVYFGSRYRKLAQ